MGIIRCIADHKRKQYIKDCINYDTPRLKSEIYPSSVVAVKDISYINDRDVMHKLDVYLPDSKNFGNIAEEDVFIDIHGGAFVSGTKEINKCFCMNLAMLAHKPVVSINYTLIPNGTIIQMVREIFEALKFLNESYGITDFNIVGDSAGGFLAFITSAAIRTKDVKHDFSVFADAKINIKSMALISGLFELNKMKISRKITNVYAPKGSEQELPEYVGELDKLIVRTSAPDTVFITADGDFLRQDSLDMYEAFRKEGINATLIDEVTPESDKGTPRALSHVYPVSSPTSPAGVRAIEAIIKNASIASKG